VSTTHEEAEAAVRRMEGYGVPDISPVFLWWRENVQPAVPTPPDDLELVEEDGVPVFRAPADDDYGWLDTYGAVRFTPGGNPSPEFNGKRYIVRQSAPAVPTDVERLTQALLEHAWSAGVVPGVPVACHRTMAQHLYDRGVRYPEQTP